MFVLAAVVALCVLGLSSSHVTGYDHVMEDVDWIQEKIADLRKFSRDSALVKESRTCGGEIDDEDFGVIQSPMVQGRYTNNLQCEWTIRVNKPRIRMVFKDIQIQDPSQSSSGVCSGDKLVVFNGTREVATLCGHTQQRELLLGPDVKVVFSTDSSGLDKGFQILWSVSPLPQQSMENHCDEYLTGPSGELVTMGEKYGNDLNCVWIIDAKDESLPALTLAFDDLDIESTPLGSCPYDKVRVWTSLDTMEPPVGTFCGQKKPLPITTETRQFRIKLESDSSTAGRGFKVRWY